MSFFNLTSMFHSRLTSDDALDFWDVALDQLMQDAEFLSVKARTKSPIFAEVGCCSHWLAPHSFCWAADGGFAWPSGYSNRSGFSGYFSGLPEFDWSLSCRFDPTTCNWKPVTAKTGKRQLLFRAALPARTAQHRQAAVHTAWMPGSPPDPKQKLIQFYGFRKRADGWQCTATRTYPGTEEVYE